jgi:hypothetical protein
MDKVQKLCNCQNPLLSLTTSSDSTTLTIPQNPLHTLTTSSDSTTLTIPQNPLHALTTSSDSTTLTIPDVLIQLPWRYQTKCIKFSPMYWLYSFELTSGIVEGRADDPPKHIQGLSTTILPYTHSLLHAQQDALTQYKHSRSLFHLPNILLRMARSKNVNTNILYLSLSNRNFPLWSSINSPSCH